MVSSPAAKAGIVFSFFGLGLIVASVVVVDWVYAVQGSLTRRYGLWQLYDISSNTYYTFPSGTVSVRIEAGRGCMVAAGGLALVAIVTGLAYLIMKDPWAPSKRYVLMMFTLASAFAGLLCGIGPALIYDSANYMSGYNSWSISSSGILAFVAIFLEGVATLLASLEWRFYDRTYGYNLLNTDSELLQDLRDYWQARGRWEERQVIDEDWAIYRYLQQRRREQNYRLKRAIKEERKKWHNREVRHNSQMQPAVIERDRDRQHQQPRHYAPPMPTTEDEEMMTPPGFYPNASRSNAVHPG